MINSFCFQQGEYFFLLEWGFPGGGGGYLGNHFNSNPNPRH